MNTTADEEKPIGTIMCGSRKYHIPPYPHGGSWKFQGVEGYERGKFPKGRRVHKELFFSPDGLKCDRIKHLSTCYILKIVLFLA